MIRRGYAAALACGLTGLLLLLSGSAADPKAERLAKFRVLGRAFYENPTTQAQAVEQFRQAWQLNPANPIDRLNYGLALLRNGQTAAGIAELEAVQQMDPKLPHTWFNLGIEYKRQGETEKAIAQLERMAELLPAEAITQYNLGVLYKNAGRIEDALAKFELAARLDPNLAAPHFQLFNYYRQNGRAEEGKRELARFQELKKKHEEAGTGNEDVEWSFYSEVYDIMTPVTAADPGPGPGLRFKPAAVEGKADAASARLAQADFDGDGAADLLVCSKAGVRIYRRGTAASPQPDLDAIGQPQSAEAGDFDNDGLPDLVVLTAKGATLLRNDRGTLRKAGVSVPAREFASALWIDYDHDYDLDLLLLGAEPALMRNQAEAGFAERTGDLPLAAGRAVGAALLRLIPDTKSHDFVVAYADRPAVLYHDRLGGRFDVIDLPMVPAGARLQASEDLDNDGQLDLYWDGGAAYNRGGRFEGAAWPVRGPVAVADFENRGLFDLAAGGKALRAQGRGEWLETTVNGLPKAGLHAVADFDLDGRVDVATVGPDGALTVSFNVTPVKNLWTRVKLTGVKNLKLATGAEVEVRAGSFYQKRVYRGLPLLFGIRGAAAIDTVRITWPNGLIQNETNQKARVPLAFQEAQRLSGSCPIIWTWNGKGFEYITDVLGVAPLGASAGDGSYFPVDHDEYVWIPGESLRERGGVYDVRITEELSEVSYLDQIELIAVDHPADVSVYSNDKWKSPPFPEFRLFGSNRRVYPVRARGADGRDALKVVSRKDRVYTGGFKRDYHGVAETHAVEFDFGAAARDGRAVLVLDGWVDWADGSTFLARAQTGNRGLQPPRLEVKNARGEWVTALEDMGMPSGKPKVIAVDLTGRWASNSRQVRIVTNLCVFWDEVFLLETDAPPPARLTSLIPSRGELRFRGFAELEVHPRRLEPEKFTYGQGRPTSAWNPTPGYYTRYGDVKELLSRIDDHMVIMGSGDEVRMCFDARRLPPLAPAWRRDFLLKVDGWAKDRDANTAYSQNVTPLPFHGMSSYPYPAGESFPDSPGHRRWQKTYNTRPALRLLRSLNEGTAR
jgi:tetratricopeptide (TPR) repeat protein